MIEHLWSILCLNVSIDRDSNSISIFNVLEKLDIFTDKVGEISIPLEFVIATLWRKNEKEKPEKGEMRICVISPSKKKTFPVNMVIDLTTAQFHRCISRFAGFKVEKSGTYHFLIDFRYNEKDDWKQYTDLPLEISVLPRNNLP